MVQIRQRSHHMIDASERISEVQNAVKHFFNEPHIYGHTHSDAYCQPYRVIQKVVAFCYRFLALLIVLPNIIRITESISKKTWKYQ